MIDIQTYSSCSEQIQKHEHEYISSRRKPMRDNNIKDSRGPRGEDIPRFQRLRDRDYRDRDKKPDDDPPKKKTEGKTTSGSLLELDLAPENFPALPSPGSPNERQENNADVNTASSLKVHHLNILFCCVHSVEVLINPLDIHCLINCDFEFLRSKFYWNFVIF